MTPSPKFPVTVLCALGGKRLTKKFTPSEKFGYDSAFWHTYSTFDVGDIEDLSVLLTALEDEPHHCIIRGELCDGIDPKGRVLRRKDAWEGYPAYFRERADGVHWCLIDFDKVPAPADLAEHDCVEYLISKLPPEFHDVTYHYQWSSSAGAAKRWDVLSCHVWFWLSEPRTDTEMMAWADSTDCVDEAVMRTVQVHYTASPIFADGARDPLPRGTRSGIVRKALQSVYVRRLEPATDVWGNTTGAFSDAPRGFEARLEQIGVRVHMPVQKAIASWVSTRGATELDELKRRLRERIVVSGHPDTAMYASERYLTASIRGASRKFTKRPTPIPTDPDAELKERLTALRGKKSNILRTFS